MNIRVVNLFGVALSKMDGILLVDKEKGITSRDVVNKISKELNIKKVGHAGTLDPLATGLMVIGIGKGTKILDLLTSDKKEYIATVKLGIQTDTLDITGNIVKKIDNYILKKDKLESILKFFSKTYMQTVPKYSAIKINGKKLYEYARNDIEIELPKKEVTIYSIELIDFKENEFTFKTLVSKGTYIRSLINDIGNSLNIPMTMKELRRTKSGKFKINDINSKIIAIKDALDFKIITITDSDLLKRVINGNEIYLNDIDFPYITIVNQEGKELAIYKKEEKLKYKAFKVF